MKKIAVVLGGLVIVVLIGLGLCLGGLIGTAVKTGVEESGPLLTQTDVSLESVRVGVLTGNAKIESLQVGNPEGFKTAHAFKVGEVLVKLDVGSLTQDTVVIEQILVDGAEITWEGSLRGSNITRIQKNINQFVSRVSGDSPATDDPKDAESDEGESTKVIIRKLDVVNCKVNLSVTWLKGKSAQVPLKDIHLTDIGEEDQPATMPEVMKEVMPTIFKGIAQAVAEHQTGGDGSGSIGDKAKDAFGKVKGLLGR